MSSVKKIFFKLLGKRLCFVLTVFGSSKSLVQRVQMAVCTCLPVCLAGFQFYLLAHKLEALWCVCVWVCTERWRENEVGVAYVVLPLIRTPWYIPFSPQVC